MTYEALEGPIAAWLEEESRGEFPDWLMAATFEVTRGEPQARGLRHRIVRLAGAMAGWAAPPDEGGIRMVSAVRVVLAAGFIAAIGVGTLLSIREGSQSGLDVMPGAPDETAQSSELFEVVLDAEAIPADLAGVLVFRKIYPTDAQISYGYGFVPPNTFVRHVESGELGIRPKSEVQVIRAGSSWAEAEILAAGEEAIIGPGDTFVMQDVPWAAYGTEALGEMWTPGDDARVVGFAIRETSRCCSMTHSGMRSPWYHTLVGGVQELRGAPVTLRIDRWDVPAGAELPPADGDAPTLRALDAGTITGTIVTADPTAEGAEAKPLVFVEGGAIQTPRTLTAGENVRLENAGLEPAIVYQLTLEPASTAAPAAVDTVATISESAPMLHARSGHSATLLDDGRVLISGGGTAEVEVYDPEAGTSEPAGRMTSIRNASATKLQDGRVLLAGGSDDPAEVFDPRSTTVTPIGSMVDERHFQSATRLHDGRVLITGGETDTAEIFDPAKDTFASTGTMTTARARHTSVLLRDTRVLVAGGGTPVAEFYDPATERFTPCTADGLQAPDRGTATRLTDGRVLLIGHAAPPQVYDPETDTVTTAGPMVTPRYAHAAVLLDDGRVLVVGGIDDESFAATASLEVFDPRTLAFEEVGSLGLARWQPAATKLCDGKILVTGGSGETAPVADTELIEVRTGA